MSEIRQHFYVCANVACCLCGCVCVCAWDIESDSWMLPPARSACLLVSLQTSRVNCWLEAKWKTHTQNFVLLCLWGLSLLFLFFCRLHPLWHKVHFRLTLLVWDHLCFFVLFTPNSQSTSPCIRCELAGNGTQRGCVSPCVWIQLSLPMNSALTRD